MTSVLGGRREATRQPRMMAELQARLAECAEQVGAAIRDCDTRKHCIARLERALVELQLRDLWGPWSREGDRYAIWMRDDIRMARTLADRLAERVGDSGLPERLFVPYPQLTRPELTW